jgi:hypothetical protein
MRCISVLSQETGPRNRQTWSAGGTRNLTDALAAAPPGQLVVLSEHLAEFGGSS